MTETQTKFLNSFELPQLANFDLSKLEVPPAFREYADGAVIQAKRGYEKLKGAAEEATELLEVYLHDRHPGRVRLRYEGDRDNPDQHQHRIRLCREAPRGEDACRGSYACQLAREQTARDP